MFSFLERYFRVIRYNILISKVIILNYNQIEINYTVMKITNQTL